MEWCSECGEICESFQADMGLGTYRIGEGQYNHTNYHTLSSCCEVEVLEHDPHGVEA